MLAHRTVAGLERPGFLGNVLLSPPFRNHGPTLAVYGEFIEAPCCFSDEIPEWAANS
jgi:hypothetical protein